MDTLGGALSLTRSVAIAGSLCVLSCGAEERRLPPGTSGGTGGTGAACGSEDACGAHAGGGATAPGGGSPSLVLPDAGTGAGETGCVRETVHFERELPNVMLVVDGSGSMILPDFDGDTRWEAVKNALLSEEAGLVPKLQAQVRFGLTTFFSSPPAGEPDPGCPVLERVPVALDNLDAVSESLRRASPRGSTPTGESLERVWPELANLDPAAFRGPNVIVLATDGEPTTCAGSSEVTEGRAQSRTAVANAFAAGVRTFVVSVGRELGDEHLRELANLGQGYPASDPAERFYRVLDTTELGAAFFAIADSVQECVFELNGTVREESAHLGDVTLDGVALTYRDPDGWHLTGPSELALDGKACEVIQSGDEKTLDISFPCGEFKPR